MLTFCEKEKQQHIFYQTRHHLKSHLYRAGHCAEGEHSSTVLYGGLAVKRSLSVNEEHRNLLRRDATIGMCCQPVTFFHEAHKRTSHIVCLITVYLAAIRLVDHKDFAPDLNSRGLPFAASPPGKPCQGLIIPSHPRLALLQR